MLQIVLLCWIARAPRSGLQFCNPRFQSLHPAHLYFARLLRIPARLRLIPADPPTFLFGQFDVLPALPIPEPQPLVREVLLQL